MKKALAILAVLVIVTGAVFADAPAGSTALIRIKSTVEREDPTFVIKAFYGDQEVTGDADGEDLEVSDISQGDVKVAFSIFQKTDAKNRFGYTFKVTVTKFKSNDYTVDKDITVDNLTGDWYTVNVADGISAIEAPEIANNIFTGAVTFNGKKAVLGSTTAKTSFDVTWTGDREAPAGDYEADVEMTITVD